LCGGSALAVAACLYGSQAFAADADATAAATDNSAASASPSVGELVVVAEKREEKIESVPVAITAFSGQQRSLMGISSVQDLTDYTPGLSFTSIDNRPYIRGLGRNTDNLASASAVAVYYNGMYFGSNAATILQKDDLFVGNIEVDRGPQNTLHGSNADGGTINYTSQRPTDSYYAEVRGGISNYDETYVEGVVSGPINDHLKFRLGANYTNESGGYFQNLDGPAQGGNVAQGNSGDSHYFEGQLEGNWDHLDIWAIASSGQFRTNYHTTEETGNIPDTEVFNGAFAPNGFYGLCGLPGVAATPGGAACAGGQPIVPGSVTTDKVTANQFPGNNPGNLNPRQFIQESTSTNDQNDDVQFTLNATYHFPSFDVTYLGGFSSFNYNLNFTSAADSGVLSYELEGAPAANAGLCEALFSSKASGCTSPLTINPEPDTTLFVEHDMAFSNEVDITSTWGSPLQYLGGLYWYHEHWNQPVDAGVEPNQTQFQHPFLLAALGDCPASTPALGGAGLCAAPGNPASASSTSDTDLTYDDLAAYGEFSYKFSDQWKLTGALRYTNDHKYGYQTWRFEEFDAPNSVAAALDPLLGIFTPGAFGANTPAIDLTPVAAATTASPGAGKPMINAETGNAQRTLNDTWGAVTGEVNLDWTPDPSTLAYAKYSRGFKSGGFNTFTLLPGNPVAAPEYVDSYEVGAKKVVGSKFTLNGDVFYYNYSNYQAPETVDESGVFSGILANIPTVRDWGVELEAVWKPIDPLTLSLSYAYLNAEITNPGPCVENAFDPLAEQSGSKPCPASEQNQPGLVLQSIKGDTIAEAPPNKVSFNALYTFTFDPGKLTLSGSVIWKDVTYDSFFNTPEYKQPAYSQVNLRATWTDAKNRYNIILFMDNVFNTIGFDAAIPVLLQAETAGTTPDILNGESLTAPRTFGVELEYRWQ
jgi:iron complex outermembrane receptor protein